MAAEQTRVAERIEVAGIVQGVGFRPFVHRMAQELGLDGWVANDSARVRIEVAGAATAIERLVERLRADAPPLARIETITRSPAVSPVARGFRIVESDEVEGPRTLVPPDTALCEDCRSELFDPDNRRYRHPFITCTNCGPRYTIITDLPYDRPHTTMAQFAMCNRCEDEYGDPLDRRFHAQPIACPDCGPTLHFQSVGAETVSGSEVALSAARQVLIDGGVLAVKGLGGFHLACDATNPDAVAALRGRKHRPDKPFAVMVAALDDVHRLARVVPAEADQLTSPARPVVLLEAGDTSPLTAGVAPGNPLVGVMLPYTPIHHLLLEGSMAPLVMTSANRAGEPITFRDVDIDSQLGPVADAVLGHDRPIHVPCDDSVVRVVGESLLPVRRARGYAPIPVNLGRGRRPVVGSGGELKNTVCVASTEHAWVSQHVGDMGALATLEAHNAVTSHLEQLFGVSPEAWAVDTHPGYSVSRNTRRSHPAATVEVQHHHAHIAAVMAEHRLDPDVPVVGFAFDGTGFGPDGAVWGGEVLAASAQGFERLAHLAPIPLPGGDAAIENPYRVALAHLRTAGVAWADDLAPVGELDATERAVLEHQLDGGFGCIPTTSMGRLFDAVASLLDLRQRITYEAQAAIDLESAALTHSRSGAASRCYRFAIGASHDSDPRTIDAAPVIRAVSADLADGHPVGAIADGFHHAVVDLIVILALELAPSHGPRIALSGGVFQNALLVGRATERLRAVGLEPLTHRIVPPSDGGLALGQAYIAAHRFPAPEEC